MTTKLTAAAVIGLVHKCLFDKEPEDKSTNVTLVRGVVNQFGFDPARVEENKDKIFELLKQLPKEFMESGGGGWSFLNACNDKDGVQWTGMQTIVDDLICLGLAIKKVEFCLPHEYWIMLPGGVPYFIVKDKSE